jgi:hypothetical protein
LARDVALWDQLACTSAQCVYVEGRKRARLVAEDLAAELDGLTAVLPEGSLTLDERIEIARLRALGEFAEAAGEARMHCSRNGLSTVVFEDDVSFALSPLRRSVWVKPYGSLAELRRGLAPARGLLQTVGLCVEPAERADYQRELALAGARRFCPVGQMNAPLPHAVHDGAMELQNLVRWVESELDR